MNKDLLKRLPLVLLLVFTACARLTNFTPERAVTSVILNSKNTFAVQADTIQVLQTQDWNDGKVLLATFDTPPLDGVIMSCTYLYETAKMRGSWGVTRSGGGCTGGTQVVEDVEVNAGIASANNIFTSDVFGRVNNPDITQINVIWDDGETVLVPVVNSSYIAIRSGEHNVETLEGWDPAGNVIFTHNPPEFVPGKP